MKPQAEYAIKPAGRLILDRYRGDVITGDVYVITKFIASDNAITTYEVIVSTFGETCTCPAGRRPTCKHRKMVLEYIHPQGELDL